MPSDSLVPANDPTLLFTGAGMNQFKEMFLGKGSLPWKRVTTAQKCLRVPDLENVGRTPRHHTFFEMLGNFSFGDYFKKECIRWEWDLFTEALGFDRSRMWVTIYLDDDEAFAIWKNDIGLPEERIYRFGEKENFWPAEAPSKGPNGVCGPCSEIYYDNQPGGPPPARKNADGSLLGSMPDGRFLEVGNCVFTQFDRREGGVLQPLPQKNIDVGLGLERIVAVLQGAPNNFETDLFLPYIHDLERRSGKRYETNSKTGIRMRRIADHLRAVVFCIADGARPGNEGRGYVVRKILRRACRDLYELGLEIPTMYQMVPLVAEIMGTAYPEIRSSAASVASFMEIEEQSFRSVYVRGINKLNDLLDYKVHVAVPGSNLKDVATRVNAGGGIIISGKDAFELHDTYGFPIDLIQQIAEEQGCSVDLSGFEREMESQQQRSRAGSQITNEIFIEGPSTTLRQRGVAGTEFTGYADSEKEYQNPARLGVENAKILGIVAGGKLVNEAHAPADVEFVLDRTPFYANGGGQVGDVGTIQNDSLASDVLDTYKTDVYYFHKVTLQRGSARVGDSVYARVDASARLASERHHTATHLLHLALKNILGEHVNQAGSLVSPDRLRFDFTHPKKLTPEEIQQIEDFVNERILRAESVSKREMAIADAKKSGAVMLFGEKYGDRVRVLAAADSVELCGGTHVGNTGNIGIFKIISEASTAAGIRRIEAVCGPLVLQFLRERELLLNDIANELKSPPSGAAERIKQLRTELKQAKGAKAKASSMDPKEAQARVRAELVKIQDGVACAVSLSPFQPEELKSIVESLKKDVPDFVVVLFVPSEDSVAFVIATHGAPGKRLKAGDLAKQIGPKIGGGGGGRPDFAQGQGKNPAGTAEAIGVARQLLSIASA